MRRSASIAGALLLAAAALAGCKQEKREFPEPETESPEGIPYRSDCAALEKVPAPKLADGAYVGDFVQVWQTVLDKHYDPTLGCLDWAVVGERYGKRVVEAGDDSAAAYAAINEMLALLGQSHMRATPPRASKPSTLPSGPARVPIEIRMVEKRPVVTRLLPIEDSGPAEGTGEGNGEGTRDKPSGPPAETGEPVKGVGAIKELLDVPVGAVLVEIGGIDLTPILTAQQDAHPGARPAELARAQAAAVSALLRCPDKAERELVFEDAEGERHTDRATCEMPVGDLVTLGNLKNIPSSVEVKIVDSAAKIGWFRFNVWMMPLMPEIRGAMAQLRDGGAQAIILDLRQNPGGVGQMAIPVARMFLGEAAELGQMHMRDFTKEFKVLSGADKPFDGPLFILVDEGTASTSEIFAIAMRDLERATIVGSGPSAGMALPSVIETLPSGGTLQFVVGDYRSPDGNVPEGTGVKPDVLVEETREAFLAGKDPVLDKAIAEAKAALENPP